MPGQLISVGQIIDKSWEHYTKHFQSLMKVSLWLLAGTLLIIIGSALSPIGEPTELLASGGLSGAETFGVLLTLISSSVLTPILLIWVVLGLILLIENQAVGKKMNSKTATQGATKKFLPYLWVSVMKTVVILLPFLLVIPGGILLAVSTLEGSSYGGGLGGLLLIIGLPLAIALALMLTIQFAFIGYELTLNHKHGRSALAASRALVKGRWWATLWRYLIPRMVFGFFATLVLLVAIAAVTILLTSITNAGIESSARIAEVFINIAASAVTILILPIITIADYYLFDSLRKA